jgi:predicted metal-dependent phosphoesterase TrpH
MLIDLHTHSTASDGTDTPGELVAAAAAAGLDVVAITDHDTTAGWIPAAEWLPAGLTLVRGAEFSCRLTYENGRGIGLHLLGYLFDPEHEALKADRARLREDRRGRGKAIVDNLIADGVPITWERVQELAAGGSVGRPHIGRALVEQGVVPDVNAAFAEHLSSKSKYYVRKADSDVYDVIAMIKAAGGVSVFAHPLARKRGAVVDEIDIVALAEAGLDGVEVDHPDHAEEDRELLRGLSARLGLIATGSSDYHGTNKSTPIGACTTDPQAYEALLSRATALGPITATPPLRR